MNKKVLITTALIFVLLLAGRFFFNSYMMKMRMMGMSGRLPAVEVKTPEEVDYVLKNEYAARTEAKYSVNLIARVQGYLGQRYFKEGDFVQKGKLLFKIKPETFVAAANQAEASLNRTQASLVAAEKNLTRVSELVEKDFVSKAQYDDALAQRDSLKAALQADRAMVDTARINLGYTNIYAPVSGKIGKVLITEGNYIDRSSGPLATIVSLDPMYVSFNVTSEEYLTSNFQKDKVVEIIMPDGSIYSQKGSIDFLDNQVEPSTGTVTLRATFENKDNLLLPGQFLNVRVYSQKPEKKLAVLQEAVMENPGGKFVYVVDKDSKVAIRPVQTGEVKDGKVIVNSGLNKEDRVIVKGLQKIMPQIPVKILNSEEQDKQPQADVKKEAAGV